MLLSGDIGGTKTLLGLFEPAEERPTPIVVRSFPTLRFSSLGDMIAEFLRDERAPTRRIVAACFGVAGPVLGDSARLTNVPWLVETAEVTRRFSLRHAFLLNDLHALAYAVPVLQPAELATLQEGDALASGNAALIAAGTGLGEAMLHNVDGRFIPSPSEGGHADFAARTEREIELLRELTRLYGRAHCEHVISGPGIVNIHRFVHRGACAVLGPVKDPHEAPAIISRAALERRCPRCVETLEIFVSAYGAEAGNHALRTVATAGVYVGGGIAPKILPALKTGTFLEAFRGKDPMQDLLAAIPVKVILNQDAGLLGAAVHANTLV